MPFELRTVAATLMALAVLLVLSASLPRKAALAVGPIETAVCVDESGREHPQSFDVLIEPSCGFAVHATSATQRLTIPALISNGRLATRTVLRL
jgi:hypothetical protein